MSARAATLRAPFAIFCALLLVSPAAGAQRSPVVVELFTSQGCSACAAADETPASFEGRKDILALTFPVDYWDYLGWRDTYASPPSPTARRPTPRRWACARCSRPRW